jgi:LPS-assembly lipoprotein
MKRQSLIAAALVATSLALAGCGFQLRGQTTLPFATLFVPGNSALVVELKRNVVSGTQTKLVDSVAQSQAQLLITNEVREKVILSLNSAGRIREYQLRYKLAFRVIDGKGRDFLPLNEIALTRDISFNDSQVLAKESEEALLYRDMQTDMVQQVLRRLATARIDPQG